jgi:MazG family protein
MEKALEEIKRCIEIMKQLRDPKTGCAWDLKQTPQSIVPNLMEEAEECKEAIESKDVEDIKEELGDVFLQIVFQSQLAEEAGQFDIGDVAKGLSEKLVRRHPHIFGSEEDRKHRDNPEMILKRWNEIKTEEKAQRKARKPQ